MQKERPLGPRLGCASVLILIGIIPWVMTISGYRPAPPRALILPTLCLFAGAYVIGAALIPRKRAAQEEATTAERVHPILVRAIEVLEGGYFGGLEHLAAECRRIVDATGSARELGAPELLRVFDVCLRYASPYFEGDAGDRRKLDEVIALFNRALRGEAVSEHEIAIAGEEAIEIHERAKSRAEPAGAALRAMADSPTISAEVLQAIDASNRDVRAALAVAQSMSVLAYVRGVRTSWATSEGDALLRLFRFAGDNTARQLLAMDPDAGPRFAAELARECQS